MMNEMSRRAALTTMGLVSSSFSLPSLALEEQNSIDKAVKVGVITDLHGGLASDADSRLDAFLAAMKRKKCDALLQLGDFAYPNNKHQSYADRLNKAHKEVLHVIGNHEFDYGLTRDDCYKAWGIESGYYRREIEGIRFLVLDGNEKGSKTHKGGYPSYVGKKQLSWLSRELEVSSKPIIILSHQPLAGRIAVDNAKDIQKLLSKFQSKIIICLNGHSHVDSLLKIKGVPYLHINSASYYWVGGKERMAYYTDPLFTTLTIDPDSATVQVAAKSSSWKGKSPEEIGYFDRNGSPPKDIVTPQIRQRSVARSQQ